MTADWPYAEDGVQRDEFAELLRLPLVSSPCPGWRYITAVVVGGLWRGVRPTDDELRVVASYHEEYLAYWYNPGWLKRMAERPFDIDGGANGRFLIKREDGGWAYRHASWQMGPLFLPPHDHEPMSLIEVLDQERSLGSERWERWKTDHAEVFAAMAS